MNPINQSALKKILISPAHFKWALENPTEQTEAMMLGSVAHCLALTPNEFKSKYVVSPKFDLRKTSDKEAKEKFDLDNQGKESIKPETFGAAKQLSQEIIKKIEWLSHTDGFDWKGMDIEKKIESEILDYNGNKIPCFGTPDLFDNSIIIDVKTTNSINEKDFLNKVFSLGYDFQLCFYNLLKYGNLFEAEHIIIAVETKPPYFSRIFEIDFDIIRNAENKVRKALTLYHDCHKYNTWYGPENTKLYLPKWAVSKENYQEITDNEWEF